jgi:hypothetical protein
VDFTTYEVTIAADDVCFSCTADDPYKTTNGETGSGSIEDCVCIDENMAVDDDGLCGCKPGYYVDESTSPVSCLECPADTYKDTTDLLPCTDCLSMVDYSFTNGTTAQTHIHDCLCHEEDGFHHEDPSVDGSPCICLAGSYLDSVTGKCELCAKGEYTDSMNVDSCKARARAKEERASAPTSERKERAEGRNGRAHQRPPSLARQQATPASARK